MDNVINKNKEVLSQLEELDLLIDKNYVHQNTINKINIIFDKLNDISDTLTNLNINLKLDNQIELTGSEREYLKCEKDSNNLIGRIMPALALLSLEFH